MASADQLIDRLAIRDLRELDAPILKALIG